MANKITLKIVVTDPLGRKAESVVSYAKPAAGVVISDIVVKKLAGQVSVSFRTNVSKSKPPIGQFTLQIILRRSALISKTILTIAMHTIPDKLPLFFISGIAGGVKQDADKLYAYRAVFSGAANVAAFNTAKSVIIQITDPKGKKTAQQQAV